MRIVTRWIEPVLPCQQDFRGVDHSNSKPSIVDGLDGIGDLHDICPHRALGNDG